MADQMLQNYQDEIDIEMDCYQQLQTCCGGICGFFRIWIPCVFCCCLELPFQQIYQTEDGLIERFGRYIKTVKPGLQEINPCTDQVRRVNKLTQILNLERQSVLTKDNITIQIDASVFFRVVNSYKSVYEVENVSDAVKFHTYAVLRNVCGIYTLQDLLEKRFEVSQVIFQHVSEHVDEWGISIDNVFIKDMLLSVELQENLSAAAKEQRLASAKIISAKADVDSAKLMREAADILDSRPAMQIRFIETIQMLTRSKNCKIIFLPNEEGNFIDHKMTQGLIG